MRGGVFQGFHTFGHEPQKNGQDTACQEEYGPADGNIHFVMGEIVKYSSHLSYGVAIDVTISMLFLSARNLSLFSLNSTKCDFNLNT